MTNIIEQESDIASAVNDAVAAVKEQGGTVEYQAKAFAQILSGQLDILGRTGNSAAKVMHDAIWGGLLGKSL